MKGRRNTPFGQPEEPLTPPEVTPAEITTPAIPILGQLPAIPTDIGKILKEHGIYIGAGFLAGKLIEPKNIILLGIIGYLLYTMSKKPPVPTQGA